MIHLHFTKAEIDELAIERYAYPCPLVQRKVEAVYLKSQALPHHKICSICRISKPTLVAYLRQYQEGGLDRLKENKYKGKTSALHSFNDTLQGYFEKNPPQNAAQAQAAIKDLTGINRCPTQIREFMKKIGMKCRKVGFVPGKACDPDKLKEQEDFLKDKLEPLLEQAREGKRIVLFQDAAHFVHGAFLGIVWCFVRFFIPSPSGRNRFNVLGALNAVTKEFIAITNETYINAESVCLLLKKITQHYMGQAVTVVLDNARYQKCALVKGYADNLGIELLFLPSYSPQLNLIERFWRFVKKECLYSQYYKNFSLFKNAITDCINQANTKHKGKLESLLTWNWVRLF